MRYEDLVARENTKVVLDELYAFMDIPYDLDTRNSTLGCLMHGGDSCTSSNDILGLHRNRDFDPNHWTKELSREVNVTNTDVESMPCQNDTYPCCSMYLILRSGAEG